MELLARIAELSAPPALIEVGFMERLPYKGHP